MGAARRVRTWGSLVGAIGGWQGVGIARRRKGRKAIC